MRFLQISLRFYSSFSEVLKMNVTGSWDTGNGGACPQCPLVPTPVPIGIMIANVLLE